MAQATRQIDVHKVAALARLTLDADEAARFAPQLARVLDAIALLDQLDTAGVEPTSHVVPLAAPLRDDAVRPGLSHEAAMALAPRTAEGAFVVPKFVEGG